MHINNKYILQHSIKEGIQITHVSRPNSPVAMVNCCSTCEDCRERSWKRVWGIHKDGFDQSKSPTIYIYAVGVHT